MWHRKAGMGGQDSGFHSIFRELKELKCSISQALTEPLHVWVLWCTQHSLLAPSWPGKLLLALQALGQATSLLWEAP